MGGAGAGRMAMHRARERGGDGAGARWAAHSATGPGGAGGVSWRCDGAWRGRRQWGHVISGLITRSKGMKRRAIPKVRFSAQTSLAICTVDCSQTPEVRYEVQRVICRFGCGISNAPTSAAYTAFRVPVSVQVSRGINGRSATSSGHAIPRGFSLAPASELSDRWLLGYHQDRLQLKRRRSYLSGALNSAEKSTYSLHAPAASGQAELTDSILCISRSHT